MINFIKNNKDLFTLNDAQKITIFDLSIGFVVGFVVTFVLMAPFLAGAHAQIDNTVRLKAKETIGIVDSLREC